MVADVIALKEKASAKEAIKTLQKDYFVTEMPFFLKELLNVMQFKTNRSVFFAGYYISQALRCW